MPIKDKGLYKHMKGQTTIPDGQRQWMYAIASHVSLIISTQIEPNTSPSSPLQIQKSTHSYTPNTHTMGCSTSKPSKSTRKLSKPSKPIPLIPLSYPYLEPLPFRPLPHHPVASGPTPEQEFASRYGRMLDENPIFASTQKSESAHRLQMKETAPQESKRVKAAKPKTPYQFKPLNEIGRATDPPRGKSKARPQAQLQSQRRRQAAAVVPKAPYQFRPLNEIGAPTRANQSGYGLYPPSQKGDFRHDVCEWSFLVVDAVFFLFRLY